MAQADERTYVEIAFILQRQLLHCEHRRVGGFRRHRADLLRRDLAALGQLAHLGGHHREALAVFAGARRLHRGVQRQQIGLVGDLLDDADLLGDGPSSP